MADKDKDIPVKITLTDKTGKEVGTATVNAPGSHTFADLTPGKTYISTLTPPDEYKVVTENPRRYTLKDTFQEKEKSLTIEIFLDKSPILGGVGQRKAGSPDSPLPDSLLISALIGFVFLLLAGDILGSFQEEPSSPVVAVSPQTNSQAGLTQADSAQASSTQIDSTQASSIPSDSTPAIGTTIDTSTQDISAQNTSTQDTSAQNTSANLIDRSPDSSLVQTQQRQLTSVGGEIFIAGEDVNVRLEPDLNSPVIAQISNGFVQVDAQAIGTTPGWQAIVLPDGTRGYVAAQFVRFLEENQP